MHGQNHCEDPASGHHVLKQQLSVWRERGSERTALVSGGAEPVGDGVLVVASGA
jgi:hypothetical protein